MKRAIPVIPSRLHDLETYISNYKGEIKNDPQKKFDSYSLCFSGFGMIGRLCFIIEKSEDLRAEATHLLLQHLKQTTNTALYKKIFCEAKTRENRCHVDPQYAIGEFDSEWVARIDAKVMEQWHIKEEELKSVSSRHIKETARFFFFFTCVYYLFFHTHDRFGHHDMGEFFYHRGKKPNSTLPPAQLTPPSFPPPFFLFFPLFRGPSEGFGRLFECLGVLLRCSTFPKHMCVHYSGIIVVGNLFRGEPIHWLVSCFLFFLFFAPIHTNIPLSSPHCSLTGKAEKKAKNLPEVLQVQLTSSSGLVELHSRNYKEAAKVGGLRD